jgi:hypothetical protein
MSKSDPGAADLLGRPEASLRFETRLAGIGGFSSLSPIQEQTYPSRDQIERGDGKPPASCAQSSARQQSQAGERAGNNITALTQSIRACPDQSMFGCGGLITGVGF